jgi:hypothetical protein
MSKKNIMSAKNIVGTHTTIIDAALDVLTFISTMDDIKISPGIITQAKRSGGRVIKFTPTRTGLEMKVLGNKTVQSSYIYTSSPESVIEIIHKKFPNSK